MQFDPAARMPLALYLLLVAGGALLVFGYVRISSDTLYFLTNDSFGYIEEAQNLLAGRGLVRAPEALDSALEYVPWPSYPPGYPVCIAALGLLGMDPTSAALAVSRSSWALLPAALVWATRPLIPLRLALVLAAVVATSPATFQYGSRAMADVPALLLTILAFGAILRGMQEPVRPLWLVVAGVVLAASYPVRTTSAATMVALAVTFGLSAALRLFSIRTLVRAGLIVGLSALPLLALVSVRNLIVFGAIQPFAQRFATMGHSVQSFRNAMGENIWGLLLDATGSRLLASLAWQAIPLTIVVLSVAGLVAYGIARTWATRSAVQRFAILWLPIFCAVGTTVVAVIRMPGYAADEYRYIAQYTWAALLLVAIGGEALLGTAKRRVRALALTAAMLILVPAHANFVLEETGKARTILGILRGSPDLETAVREIRARGWPLPGWLISDAFRTWFAADFTLRSALASLPSDAVVLASYPYHWFLSFESRRRVRGAEFGRLREGVQLIRKSGSADADGPVYIMVLPSYDMLVADHPQGWQQTVIQKMRPDFVPVQVEKNFVLARHSAAGQ